MRCLFFAATSVVLCALSSTPAAANCTHCVVQTKTPSQSEPGKFEYRVSCIVDLSGDEVNTVVTAASDEEAMAKVRGGHC
jgi:hypothetical protein